MNCRQISGSWSVLTTGGGARFDIMKTLGKGGAVLWVLIRRGFRGPAIGTFPTVYAAATHDTNLEQSAEWAAR